MNILDGIVACSPALANVKTMAPHWPVQDEQYVQNAAAWSAHQ